LWYALELDGIVIVNGVDNTGWGWQGIILAVAVRLKKFTVKDVPFL